MSDNGTTNGSGDPQTDLGSVSFAVTEVADTPLVTNATTSEDTQSTAGLVISRNVADSAAVTHFKITAITGGTLFQNDGTTAIGNGSFITFAQANAGLKFTPASNVNSPAGDAFSFGVQASISAGDAGLNGAVATANVTVTEVNDAPTAVDDSLSAVAEDSGQRTISFASLLGNDSKGPSDESGQALTITAVNNAVGGSVSISGTDVLFTPNANFNGVASFDYTVSDNGTTSGSGDPQTDLGSVSFAVTEVADTPLVTNATTSEDTQSTAGLVISRNVADSAAVTHFKITAITGGTLFQNDGTTAIGNGSFITFAQANAGLKFTPASNVNSPAGDAFSFGVQASISAGDAGLNGAVATANVTVTEVNDAPTAVDDSLSAVAEDSGQRTISFASLLGNDSKGPSDESGQALTITAVNNAVGGSVSISGTDVLFTPNANFNGVASFDYTVSDNGTTSGTNDFKSDIGTVSFTVTEGNDAVTAVDDALSPVAEDSGQRTISFASLLGNDSKGPSNESGQTLTITAVSNPVGGTVSISGTNVLFTPECELQWCRLVRLHRAGQRHYERRKRLQD